MNGFNERKAEFIWFIEILQLFCSKNYSLIIGILSQ